MGAFDDLIPTVEEKPAPKAAAEKPVLPSAFDDLILPVDVTPNGPPSGFGTRSDREANDADMRKSEYLADALRMRQRQDDASPKGRLDAYTRGVFDWIPGVDKLAAAGGAALGVAKGETFGERYEEGLLRDRAVTEADKLLMPGSRATGLAAGFLPTAMALPVSNAVKAGPVISEGVATALNAGITGAGYGAVTGAIEDDGGVLDKTKAALTTGVMGGGLGLVAPVAVTGVGKAASFVGDVVAGAARPLTGTIRGAFKPEQEAVNRVQRAFTKDGVVDPTDDLARLQSTGADTVLADAGGENVRALARSSANLSPEARMAVDDATIERGRDQGPRLVEQLRQGGNANSPERMELLQEAAKKANREAYKIAERDGEAGIWTEKLANLARAPAVEAAFKTAIKNAGNRAALEDGVPMRSPFGVDDAGNLTLKPLADGSVPIPNLRFWDQVQRDLRSAAEMARRSGDDETAGVVGGLRKQLLSEIDTAVPSFKDARTGAARAFGAEDALEAGETFAASTMKNADARAALAKMAPAERELFAEGHRTGLINRIREIGDNRDLSKALFNSPAARERNEMALGKTEAMKLEAAIKVEQTLTLLQKAMGNSTTARQLVELGLANGAGAGIGGGVGYLQGGWSGAAAGAAAGAALRKGRVAVDNKLAKQIGEILTSSDPKRIKAVADAAAKNPSFMKAIEALGDDAAAILGTNAPSKIPALPFGSKPVSAEEDQNAQRKN